MTDKSTEHTHDPRTRKASIILLGLGVCLVVLAITSFLVGRYPIRDRKSVV